MALILNIRAEDMARDTLVVAVIGDEASEIASHHHGQSVALGISDVAGVWLAIGIGTLAGYWGRNDITYIVVTDCIPLSESVPIVTGGDASRASDELPYAIDTLDDADANRLLSDQYGQSTSAPLFAAEEVLSLGESRLPIPERNSWSDIHAEAAAAYSEKCAFTGLKQRSVDGRFREGVVVPVDGQRRTGAESVNGALFSSRTMGFCYRKGLLAIGEDYEILRHRQLCAELRMLLEAVNRRASLFLPDAPTAWPDLEAARRHRLRFGY